MHRHKVVIHWSSEDDLFIAEAPELPGCLSHGDTREEALASITEAMDLWIDTAREIGDPVPEPKGYPSTPE